LQLGTRPNVVLGHERRFRDVRDKSGLPPTPERLRQRAKRTVNLEIQF